jgi:hypothetical protein
LGRATNLCQTIAIPLHFRVVRQPVHRFSQNLHRVFIRWLNNSVVDPWTVATGCYHVCTPKISQMATDLWLVNLENLNKETDAHLVGPHETQQPQSCSIGQRSEK